MIAVTRCGAGPPLVIVHGAVAGSFAWGMVAPLLTSRFSVFILDRRGHGGSSNTAPYAVEREVEDIIAVLERIGEPAYLLGHSSGAILSLMVAEREQPLRRLILYEPPLWVGGIRPRPPIDLPERLDALLAAGDRDTALRTFLREGPGTPDAEIDRMRAHNGTGHEWSMMTARAHTLPHDARITTGYTLDPSRLRAVRTPTLLLLGSESPPWVQTDIGTLAATLPCSRIALLPGQDHLANIIAPDLLVREICRFLDVSGAVQGI
jgi:pimeloyl-ACP methyl ester carboxylesterase